MTEAEQEGIVQYIDGLEDVANMLEIVTEAAIAGKPLTAEHLALISYGRGYLMAGKHHLKVEQQAFDLHYVGVDTAILHPSGSDKRSAQTLKR